MTRLAISAAAIYCRLSQDRTGESLGIDRQEQLCRGLADDKGWTVAEVYVDRDLSAYSGKRRPDYERLLDDLKNGLRDAVIVVDQDRLTRNPRELESFIELADSNSVALASVSGEIDLATSDGRFRARIMGTVARQESEKKSERLKRQREQAARLGKFQGGPRRYGFDSDGMTLRKDEAKIICEIAGRFLDGESARSIVLDLNERGVPTTKGGQWEVTTLLNMISAPRLAGLRSHHGEVVADAEWEAILDRNTHERLRALLIDGRPASRGRPPLGLLGGLATCSRCGARLNQTRQRGKRVYRCSMGAKSRSCSGVIVQADDLDAFVSEVVLHRLDNKAVARAMTRPKSKGAADAADVEDVSAIDADLEALAADYGAGRISRREWLAAREPLEARRKVALVTLEGMAVDDRAVEAVRVSGDVRKTWSRASMERQRQVLRALIERLVVGPTLRHGSNAFDSDRVDIVWKA